MTAAPRKQIKTLEAQRRHLPHPLVEAVAVVRILSELPTKP
jgi:hypothetical protein